MRRRWRWGALAAVCLALAVIAIIETFAQAHPRLSQLNAAVEYFSGWLMLFAALVAALVTAERRRDRTSPPTP